jgi:hypothetical protein
MRRYISDKWNSTPCSQNNKKQIKGYLSAFPAVQQAIHIQPTPTMVDG